MASTHIMHQSTTKDASVIVRVLDEGTKGQRISITYEEKNADGSVRRTLFRLSKEETEQVAHALKRPASETCRSCAHRKKFDVPEDCTVYGKYYCDAYKNAYGGYEELRYPDTPSCRLYQKEIVTTETPVKAELKTLGASKHERHHGTDGEVSFIHGLCCQAPGHHRCHREGRPRPGDAGDGVLYQSEEGSRPSRLRIHPHGDDGHVGGEQA